MPDVAPEDSSPLSSRAVLLLLMLAFAATVAASVINGLAVDATHERIDALRQTARADPHSEFAALTEYSAAVAEQVMQLQSVNLALMVLAVVLTATALLLHFRRPPIHRWVTVCAWTRRVQWQGRWIPFEDYLAQRFNLRCTHGICDEEAEKLRQS